MDRTRENNEEMGAAAGRSVAETAASAAQTIGDGLEQGRAAMEEVQAIVVERTRECIDATDAYVRENPWRAVGIAAGVGVIVGMLITRR
jgi:ElaB/YqjD/DUF883 family membrane-anchored ribosome-binding protein